MSGIFKGEEPLNTSAIASHARKLEAVDVRFYQRFGRRPMQAWAPGPGQSHGLLEALPTERVPTTRSGRKEKPASCRPMGGTVN